MTYGVVKNLIDVIKEKSATCDNLDEETKERMKRNLIALFTKYSSFEENTQAEQQKDNKSLCSTLSFILQSLQAENVLCAIDCVILMFLFYFYKKTVIADELLVWCYF